MEGVNEDLTVTPSFWFDSGLTLPGNDGSKISSFLWVYGLLSS